MDEQAALGLYRTMTRIRQFEKRAHDLFLQNLVKGTTHLGTGQEAIAAGVAAAMRPDDYTFVTYRGHNHVLARGTDMTPVMAELLGRQNGLMRGKGGSMHLLDVSRGVLGSYAIIGAQLVIANGTAWSAQYRGSGQVTVCFFGDGATNIGAFHEALNLAVVWALPVVFICENNRYMEYTAIETVTAVKRPAADRAPAYGLPSVVVDGNDVEAVHAAAAVAIDRAREGGGPSLLEAITYRHGGHSRADPGKYRPADEVAEWLARDPIPAYRGHNHVLARGTEMTPVMAELLGRQNGLMRGKGGSMHLLDVSRGVLGSYAIIGAQLVIANGTAWSSQYRGSGQVTVCFFGDGATNIGAFHEALNLAVVWALPVVFICENNHYMEYTAIETVTAVKRPAADRAPAYGLPSVVVDGNDVEAVHAAAAAAIDRAREGGGPSLLEAITYRHGGHSRADPGKYRPADEVAEWLARDPVPAYRGVLISRGVDEEVLDQIDAAAKAAVDLATEEAKAGPEPDLDLAFTNVWHDGGWAWRSASPGDNPRAERGGPR